MLRMPSPLMFVYYSSAFGYNARRLGYLLLETTITEFTTISFVCFIQAARYSVADLFLSVPLQALTANGRLRALTANGRICANEGVLRGCH